MINLCIHDLAEITRGRLRFGSMPPIAGGWEPVQRLVIELDDVKQGDVYWDLKTTEHGNWVAEEAFSRGAFGVVATDRRIEPWAGRFSLQVDDCAVAMTELLGAARVRFPGRVILTTDELTARLIAYVLQSRLQGEVIRLADRDNSELPCELMQLTENADFAVIQLAASGDSRIHQISHLCRPHIAVITRPTHLTHEQKLTCHAACRLLDQLPDDCRVMVDDELSGLFTEHHRYSSMIQVGSAAANTSVGWPGREGNQLCLQMGEQTVVVPNVTSQQGSAVAATIEACKLMSLSEQQILHGLSTFAVVTDPQARALHSQLHFEPIPHDPTIGTP